MDTWPQVNAAGGETELSPTYPAEMLVPESDPADAPQSDAPQPDAPQPEAAESAVAGADGPDAADADLADHSGVMLPGDVQPPSESWAEDAPAAADTPATDAPATDTPAAEHAPAAEETPQAEDAPAAEVTRAEDTKAGGPQVAEDTQATNDAQVADDIDRTLDALSALHNRIGDLADAAAELTRLRSRDTDLIARLHEDVTRLRNGEIASALNPVVTGMIKLHDQMVSLGALSDPASPVGMLHTQLLQILELTCAVRPFTPAAADRFDASHHIGMKRIPTSDPSADGTVASTIRVGFARADGSVVRVAEVEVHRLSG